jgi:hypothetical protein
MPPLEEENKVERSRLSSPVKRGSRKLKRKHDKNDSPGEHGPFESEFPNLHTHYNLIMSVLSLCIRTFIFITTTGWLQFCQLFSKSNHARFW